MTFKTLLCAALLASALPRAQAQAAAPQLPAILAQMDASSAKFKSATATFNWTFVEKVASMTDTTRQHGSMFIERSGNAGISFGAQVFDDEGGATATPSKIIDFSSGTARVYTPAEKQEDLFKAGNNQSSFESFLSLGFGGSGRDLARSWQITDGGPEVVAGVKTEKLVLVSKDPGVRNTFKQVTLWIDPTRDVSLKQLFELPSGDQRTAIYSDIRLNSKVNKKPFEIPSKGVTVVPH